MSGQAPAHANMKHVFAYLASGTLVHPLSVIHKGASLRCATCDKPVVLRRSKGIPGRRYVRPHFAIKSAGGGCGSACSGGGGKESEEHLTAKNILIHRLHDLRIEIPLCKGCDKVRTVSLRLVEFDARLERRVGGLGRLRFDVVVTMDGKDVGIIEVCHTHATDRPKVEAVLARGLWYVEYKAADVMHWDETTADGESIQLTSLAPRDWITDVVCPACVARRERQLREAEAKAKAEEERRERQLREAEVKARAEKERLELLGRAKEMSDAEVLLAGPGVVDGWRVKLEARVEEYALMRSLGRECASQAWQGSRIKYARGFWKCTSGCGWYPPGDLFVIERDDKVMTYADFDDYESYVPSEYQNDTIRLCNMCAVRCEMCGQPFPRDNAVRYGLCLGCNVECKELKKVMGQLTEEPLAAVSVRGLNIPEHEAVVVRRYLDGLRVPVVEPEVVVQPSPPSPRLPCPVDNSTNSGVTLDAVSESPGKLPDVRVEVCLSKPQNASVPRGPVDALQTLMRSQGRHFPAAVSAGAKAKKRTRAVSDVCDSKLLFSQDGMLVSIGGTPLKTPIDDPVARLCP